MKNNRTRSQEKLLSVLKKINRPISAQDLHRLMRDQAHNMGLATVYRSLENLKRDGEIQARTLSNGEAVYSLVQRDQHHLTCVQCDRSIPIPQCPVHNLETQLEQSHHFKVYYHTLEFFGLCDHCQLLEGVES